MRIPTATERWGVARSPSTCPIADCGSLCRFCIHSVLFYIWIWKIGHRTAGHHFGRMENEQDFWRSRSFQASVRMFQQDSGSSPRSMVRHQRSFNGGFRDGQLQVSFAASARQAAPRDEASRTKSVFGIKWSQCEAAMHGRLGRADPTPFSQEVQHRPLYDLR